MKPIIKQALYCLAVLYCVIGFLYVSEQDFQEELAIEEFYNER